MNDKPPKPMYQNERMSRLAKWFFGIPLIYTLWRFFSVAMPSYAESPRMEILLNIISYALFIVLALLVVQRFLNFPAKRMLGEDGKLDWRGFAVGFSVMLGVQLAMNFIAMAVNPQDFKYTLDAQGWILDWTLALVLVVAAAFLEELLTRAYIAHFVNDDMETRPLNMLYYCLASAVVFAIAHFSNPEVAGTGAFYAMAFYFMMGFVLMLVTLRTRSMGAALGIHIANNLVNAWFFTYDNAAVKTNALYTQANNEGPMLLVQAAVSLAVCTLAVLYHRPMSQPKESSK